jgi:hypothetical protein
MKGMRWIAVVFGAVALLAIAAGAGFAGAASAAAVVTIDYSTSSSSDPGEPIIDECRPDLTVTSFFGTGETRVETVETAVGFHYELTEVGTARIDWSDGSYSLIKVQDHFSFNAGNGTQTVVFTSPHVDSVKTYTAEGEFLYGNQLHRVEHFTITDGVVRVDFDRFHFNSFGDC